MDFRHLKFYLQSNWLKTICFNFRMFPFKSAIHFPVLFFGKCYVHCGTDAKVNLPKKISTGMLLIGNSNSYTMGIPNTRPEHSYFNIEGTLTMNGSRVYIGNGCRVYIRKDAELILGERSYLSNRITTVHENPLTFWETSIFSTV